MGFFTLHFAKLEIFARFFLATILIFSGVKYFFNLIEMPLVSLQAKQFLYALDQTGYLMPLIKGIELFVGVMFLLNRYVFQCVLLILPIIFNILLFHLFLDVSGLLMGFLLTFLLFVVILSQKKRFLDLFKTDV